MSFKYKSIEEFAQFIQLKDLAPKTQERYLSHIRMAGLHFGMDPAKLKEPHIKEYFLFLRNTKNYTPNSMNQSKVALQTFFHGYLKFPQWNVFPDLKIRRVDPLPVILSIQEVRRLLRSAPTLRDQTIFTLIYNCGLRIGECLALEVKDIDSDRGLLHIRKGKGRKDRYVPITNSVIIMLRQFWKLHKNPTLLFPSTGRHWKTFKVSKHDDDQIAKYKAMRISNKPVSKSAIQQVMKDMVLTSGIIKGVTTHTLRHCYATHLLEAGVSIRVISKYLGHATLNQTLVYAHLTKVSEDHTIEVLIKLLNQVSPLADKERPES